MEKHGRHGMILPWSYHDHGETWSWSCHDNGMAAMFLSMVAMIHDMIMVWLPCFPCFIPWSWYDHHVMHIFLKAPILTNYKLWENFFSLASKTSTPSKTRLHSDLNEFISKAKRKVGFKKLIFSFSENNLPLKTWLGTEKLF